MTEWAMKDPTPYPAINTMLTEWVTERSACSAKNMSGCICPAREPTEISCGKKRYRFGRLSFAAH